jgi:histone deacetylase 1/2
VQDGATDKQFLNLFKPIMTRIMEVYNPGAVVLQCGADSLAADRLGTFQVTIAGTFLYL